MATDKERREVAAKLRGNPEDTLIPHRTGRHYGMGCHEAADRFWNMCYRIREAGNYDIAFSTTSVLADLIEPGEPKVKCVAEVKVDGERLEELVHDAAVELTGIDRDALLKLADEIQMDGADSLDDDDWCKGLLYEYAARIRKALGVEDFRPCMKACKRRPAEQDAAEPRELFQKEEEQGMRHEFTADVGMIVEGTPNEAGIEPPATVSACGLSGDEVDFSLRGAARRDAAKWFGKRVKVTIEMLGKE